MRKVKSPFGVEDTSTVKQVQQALNNLGWSPPLTVDGVAGPLTNAAVLAFQQQNGLSADGIIGPQTLRVLGIRASGPTNTTTVEATELPDRATPMTGIDVTKAISAGYKKVIGRNATPSILNLLVSQAAFETGNFGAGIHNYNFGNKKFSSGDPHYQYFRCWELVDGEQVWYDPPNPICKFAAYSNSADAGAAFVKLIQGRPNWWAGLQTGDPGSYVAGLASPPAYFTADPSEYLAGLNRYFSEYADLAAKYAVPAGLGLIGTALAGVAGLLGWRAYKNRKRV